MLLPGQVLVGWYLFLLGLAAGLTLLAMTAYLTVSPPWLRWLLVLTGVLVMGRYCTMALFALYQDPQPVWGLRRYWLGTSIGLTLPTVVALDQLVRHPAMTPRKLLTWFAPFLAAYLLILLFGAFQPTFDPVIGWRPVLTGPWPWILAGVQTVFVGIFLWLSSLVMRRLPFPKVRLAIAVLMASQVYLALDGYLILLHVQYFRPFLFSEMTALAAIWFALQTARTSSG